MSEKSGCDACKNRKVLANREPCASCSGDKWVLDDRLSKKVVPRK